MDLQVIWAPSARLDLKIVVQEIAKFDEDGAERIGRGLIEVTKRLGLFPHSGRVVPEFGWDSLREIVFRKYRIIYSVRTDRNSVEIVRVWHGARGHPVLPLEADSNK